MYWRIRISGARPLHFLTGWPCRVWRLLLWILWIQSPRGKHAFLRWLAGIFLLALDLTPLSLIYELFIVVLNSKVRSLNTHEKQQAHAVFGQSIPLHLVTLNPDSFPVKKKQAIAFVSFYTVNCYGDIPDCMLIHELVHVWQYERHGSAYISEALWAQHWGGGYDYGGIEPLKMYSEGKRLGAFNFEQQADIIEDYFRWKNGLPLQWALNVPGIGEVLEKYKNQLQ